MKVKPSKRAGEVLLEVGQRDERMLAAAAAPEVSIKRILVPIDFSECSRKALRYALALAREHSAALSLLYVVPTPAYGLGEYGAVDYAYIEAEMQTTGKKELARVLAQEIGQRVPAEPIVRTGAPAREIVAAAKESCVDLIVISTHGHTGFKHVLLGSVAEQVVRHAPCPVLVVREQEHEFVRS